MKQLFVLLILFSTGSLFSLQIVQGKASLENATIKLFQIEDDGAKLLKTTKTNSRGAFRLQFSSSKKSTLYITAESHKRKELVFATAFKTCCTCTKLIINERSTVATGYAFSQFLHGNEIFGPQNSIDVAFSTFKNLINNCTATPSTLISNNENGSISNIRSTKALQILNSVSNTLYSCTKSSCQWKKLFSLTDPCEPNTLSAVQAICQNPVGINSEALFSLSTASAHFSPALLAAPDAWSIALHFVNRGLCAPGRMAFSSQGTVWSNNNFMPPAGAVPNLSGLQVTVLDPQANPVLGSPIFSTYVKGSGYGTAVDVHDNGWISSFDDGQLVQFSGKDGSVLQHTTGLGNAMGIAFDQKGNLWMVNIGDAADPLDFGSVVVFIGADLNNRVDWTQGIHKPFSVAIDSQGRAWIANSGLIPVGSVTILKLLPNNTIIPVQIDITSAALNAPVEPGSLRKYGSFASPKTIAIDQNDNGWVNNLEVPKVSFIDGQTFQVTDFDVDPLSRGWGLAIDGSGRVWAQSFSNPPLGPLFHLPPVISVLSSDGTFLYSFSNASLQHVTALQIDPAGNIWVANNWALETTPEQIISGDGLVEFVGSATPVQCPLVGPPQKPHS